MKFQVGNKYQYIGEFSDFYTFGNMYRILEVHSDTHIVMEDDYDNDHNWSNMELFDKNFKQDLRDLLKVGCRVVFRDKHSGILDPEWITGICSVFDNRLESVMKPSSDIVAIYRPKYNGLKPMEWVEVWKREAQLFTLELPQEYSLYQKSKTYLCKNGDSTFIAYDYDSRTIVKDNKFTQQEIDNLPNQAFIKTLIQKPV